MKGRDKVSWEHVSYLKGPDLLLVREHSFAQKVTSELRTQRSLGVSKVRRVGRVEKSAL